MQDPTTTTSATIVYELRPVLPLKDMNAAPLCKAVVAQVTNPRALAKMFAALHNRSKHLIVLSDLDDNDGNSGAQDDDVVAIKLLEYWGFSVVGEAPSSSANNQHDCAREEWPPLPALDHLKMVRKNFATPSSSASASTEILIGILPQCVGGIEDGVARRAGLIVCRHLQSVLLANPNPAPQTTLLSTKQHSHPVVGKKTQREPVNSGELEGVFAGVALTDVPLYSPVRRDNWDRANSVWPLTTPTPRTRHLSITSTHLQDANQQKAPQPTADELFVRKTVGIVHRYEKDFMRVDMSVAVVCKVDSGEVIAAVKMPLLKEGPSKGLMKPYFVDVDDSATQCRLGQHFINHLTTTTTRTAEEEDGKLRPHYENSDGQLPLATPFFAHAAFEALRLASVVMHNRLASKEPSTTTTTPTRSSSAAGGGGVEDYLCNGLDLICNIEPCTMCAMACVHSRLNRLVYLHRNVGGHGGVSGSITTPHEVDGNIEAVGENNRAGGFRVHCCPSLNHHFTTYEMQFTDQGNTMPK